MTVKQWFLIVCICITTYLAPQLLPEPVGADWFVYMSSWSVLAIWLILSVSTLKTAILAATIEFFAILVNTAAFLQFVGETGIFYTQYETIIGALCLLQGLIILIGAPWHGVGKTLKSIRMGNLLHLSHIARRVQADRCSSGEEACK